jgi:hypothetical protein
MYYWKCKPDGTIEMRLDRFERVGNAWYFLDDTLAGKYNYVTMVKTDSEEIFIWHKKMKERT